LLFFLLLCFGLRRIIAVQAINLVMGVLIFHGLQLEA
jgi:hypothetical protein